MSCVSPLFPLLIYFLNGNIQIKINIWTLKATNRNHKCEASIMEHMTHGLIWAFTIRPQLVWPSRHHGQFKIPTKYFPTYHTPLCGILHFQILHSGSKTKSGVVPGRHVHHCSRHVWIRNPNIGPANKIVVMISVRWRHVSDHMQNHFTCSCKINNYTTKSCNKCLHLWH